MPLGGHKQIAISVAMHAFFSELTGFFFKWSKFFLTPDPPPPPSPDLA
jgi:hypothetical protein